MKNNDDIVPGAKVLYNGEVGVIHKEDPENGQYILRVGQTEARVNSSDFEMLPVVGMGATVYWYSDRTACTVIKVSKGGNKITLQEDRSERIDKNGMSDQQEYTYHNNPEGRTFECYRRDDGTYGSSGKRIVLGIRRTYHDYSF